MFRRLRGLRLLENFYVPGFQSLRPGIHHRQPSSALTLIRADPCKSVAHLAFPAALARIAMRVGTPL